MVAVYFATNRKRKRAGAGYGDTPVDDPAQCEYGVIEVTGTDTKDADSGSMAPPTAVQAGGFADATRAAIIGSGKNLLVFVHGFANSFDDAVKRAAFNRQWLAETGKKGADATVLAFSWPSPGRVLGRDLFRPTGAYEQDHKTAARSGPELALFLREALSIAAAAKAARPATKVFLLAHSMGHIALNGAMRPFFQQGDPPALFDEAILAASDVDDAALEKPRKFPLHRLRDLAARIHIYHSNFDLPLKLSMAINGYWPLGLGGADSEDEDDIYPPEKFRSVSCSLVFDLHDVDGSVAFDASHQYYRRSRTVRANIAAVLSGDKVKPGMSWLFSRIGGG